MMNWKFHTPEFEFDRSIHSTWWGHTWFAYDLVRNVKPERIVELGTHYGVSFFSMCQAVKDGKLNTELNAVDTWVGDAHAKVGYDKRDAVFHDFEKNASLYFNNLNIAMHRKTFNDALNDFTDGSVDILHIDGFHTYEAVKNDFEKWLPKVKNDGIVLFHDVYETKDDFGVHILWNELKNQYAHVDFMHYHGLGVLFKGDNFNNLVEHEDLWRHYYDNFSKKNDCEYQLKKLENIENNFDELVRQNINLNRENQIIKASKFWKLRNFYMKCKIIIFGK